jgi:hypothetical protein
MAAPNLIDLVLVIDTSHSMRPCIDLLKQHLRELIQPVQGYSTRLRFGLVGLSASVNGNRILYRVQTLAGGTEALSTLYQRSPQIEFLSDNQAQVLSALEKLHVTGNEDNLLALDIALDHPFGPIASTKRVVALFSDEKIEAGVQRQTVNAYIPRLIEKLHARRIKLFCAMPYSPGAQLLSEANGSEIEDVDGGAGLSSVDFKTLLAQMGKSISISSMQGGLEERYERALFGQDKWGTIEGGWTDNDGH